MERKGRGRKIVHANHYSSPAVDMHKFSEPAQQCIRLAAGD